MTDDTKTALQQATDAYTAARATADREIKACLAKIAEGMPERALEAAKRIAMDQPEVSKSLGKDGVAEVRSEIAVAAEELARQFVAAEKDYKWPLGTGYTKVEKHNVHSALFNRFYGHTGGLSKVLTDHGYELSGDPFIPQSLYDQSTFGPLAAALNALGAASDALDKAKKADDNAVVENLWG